MSIPKSKRPVSSEEHYEVALTLRAKITEMLIEDFGDDKAYVRTDDGRIIKNKDYWLYQQIRERIFNYAADLIMNITTANAIYITSAVEYNIRRKYITSAITNCEQAKQELNYAAKVLPIPRRKYLQYNDMLKGEKEHLKNWRKADNKVLKRLTEA